MKRAIVAVLLAGCGGPLSGVHLESAAESQRRAIFTITLPAVERTDGVMRSWAGGEAGASTVRDLLLALYGIDAAAAARVAGDHPIGLAAARIDLPGPQGPVPVTVNALAFALRDAVSAAEWLDGVGNIGDRAGPLALVTQGGRMVAEDPSRRYGWLKTGRLYCHLGGNQVIVSGTLQGLLLAGPAAAAARHAADGDLVMNVHPPVWAQGRVKELAGQLAAFLDLLRRGKDQLPPGTAGLLAVANALHYLQPLVGAQAADLTLKVDAAGAQLGLRTSGAAGPSEAPLAPALDRALTGGEVAALGAVDCRRRIRARQQLLIGAWQAAGGPGVAELERLVDAQQAALEGSCSFAVRTQGEIWREEASYPLRPGESGEALLAALTAAIRSGGWPGLNGALEDLKTSKLLLSTEGSVVSLDRVLGDTASPGTRQAAALRGSPILRERFAIRDGRLLALSGTHAAERLGQLSQANKPGPIPPELERALAAGQGKGGFVFLDLAALWRPYLKAAQVSRTPLAQVVARNATLLKERRPVVVTIEPGPDLDATVTLPPQTFFYLLAVASLLFSGS
jgi:hypothetical protein